MGSVPSPYAWAIADNVTASLMNAQLRDSFGWFLNPPRVIVYNTAVQSIPGLSSSQVLLTWTTAVINSDGMWAASPTPSRLTAQTAGVYLINLHLQWQAGTAMRAGRVSFNSNGAVSGYTTIGYHETQCVSDTTAITDDVRIFKYMNVGDYVEAVIDDTTSSTTGVIGGPTNFFSARWVAGG